MTKQVFSILFLASYFLLGCILLPDGDFALLPELPVMYHQCQSTEHEDMNVLDFVTDHLMNIDGFFDKHNHNDPQKPHHPFHFQHSINMSIVQHFPTILQLGELLIPIKKKPLFTLKNWFSYNHPSYIFRPPIWEVGL